MKDMNDKELDSIITATLAREHTIRELNRTIVSEVSRRSRKKVLRRWGRVVAFSFGLPLLLLVFTVGIHLASSRTSLPSQRYLMLIPLLAMAYITWREMKNFSIAEV